MTPASPPSEAAAYRAEVRAALAERMKAARERKGYGLDAAAAHSGMRRQELWQAECNLNGFSAVQAMVLAAFYGISLDGLAEMPPASQAEAREKASARP